jgi:hypothetical protein
MGGHSRGRRPVIVELTASDGVLASAGLIAAVVVLFALVGFAVYTMIAVPRDMATVTILLDCVSCAFFSGRLVLNLLHRRWRSAPQLAARIEEALPALALGITLLSMTGARYGLGSGIVMNVLIGLDALVVLALPCTGSAVSAG